MAWVKLKTRNLKDETNAADAVLETNSPEREWWMTDFPAIHNAAHKESDEEDIELPDGWWGGPPPQYAGPKTRCPQRGFCACLRELIAGGRRRYRANGFDLDLTYITTKIIAMGFPTGGIAAAWRNPSGEVQRFFDECHTNGDWRIYNLCSEKSFQDNGFCDKTKYAPSPDHCPMPLGLLYEVCQDLEAHLKGGKDNVAAIHCKAGKGRTGMCICALLVYAHALTAIDAVRWFAEHRGGHNAGVTIPSQLRWIAMFEHICRLGSAKLLIDPFTCNARRKIAYKLVSIYGGPVGNFWQKVLSGKEADSSDSDEEMKTLNREMLGLSATVRLANRECISKIEIGKEEWKSKDETADVDKDGNFFISLSDEPTWKEQDGLLEVTIQPRSPLGDMNKSFNLSAWWSYAFLKRTSQRNRIALQLRRSSLDFIHNDVNEEFVLTAFFEMIPPEDVV